MRRQIGRVAFGHFCPLPYPMLLGRRPIAVATMASTVTTRMAAAYTSTSFSVAQSPFELAGKLPEHLLAATPPASKSCGWRRGGGALRSGRCRAVTTGTRPRYASGERVLGAARHPWSGSGHLMKSARSERWQLPRYSSSGDGPEAMAARAVAS